MYNAKSSIFRQHAIEQYMRRKERDILPHLLSIPITFLLWTALTVLLGLGCAAWFIDVPIIVSGTGIILDTTQQTETVSAQKSWILPQENNLPQAVLFLRPEDAQTLHSGLSAFVHIGSSQTVVESKIIRIETNLLSPSRVQQRFQLPEAERILITQPSQAVFLRLPASFSPTNYAGSLITVDIKTGTQRIISQLPVVGKFFKG